eukprot:TRINITY_DN2957_c0_g1_i1.p1 TRINITY_DN2957_c0_g1~~TRINITY_DN2957_c0_g1_i1.p1  ORF type:complete len:444 (+),score=89.46 TRINITY_DN2957_c0_g1_i1:146-1477(+)
MKNEKRLFLSLIALLLLLPIFVEGNGLAEVNTEKTAIERESVVDDCCCSFDKVSQSNSKDINPILNQIANVRFFRYFKVNLEGECPFWVAHAMCMRPGCSIDVCSKDEVPECWESNQGKSKTDLVEISTPSNFLEWKDTESDMWIQQESSRDDLSYVDLQKYPESFTGYDGRMVWDQIYHENCFKGTVDSMCLEERVFSRLISGLHASINTHIAYQYELDADGKWNHNYFIHNNRVGSHPDRIKNLYFTFVFLLRAVHKIAPILEKYHFQTGNQSEDERTHQLIMDLLKTDFLCSPNFDESTLFREPQKETIKTQFMQHFRNISLITDCVTCEKCKVYSKLQILGLGTALKILFSGKDAFSIGRQLERNEIIALLGTSRQFSNSIEFIKKLSLGQPQQSSNLTNNDSHLLNISYSGILKGIPAVAAIIIVVLFLFRENKKKNS